VDRFARVVLGYHGCSADFAGSLLSGETTLDDWKESRNPYDWLGHGIYFWEHAPERARRWAESEQREKKGVPGAVVGAVIQLGRCLDFTDVAFTHALASVYKGLKESYAAGEASLQSNKRGNRMLDCLVINELARHNPGGRFQTVRSPFLEGRPAFPHSGIRRESHIQVAVIDRSCILGVFRPTSGSKEV